MEQKEALAKKYFDVPNGTISLSGNNFTIITFHGNNFKTQKWALFSLNEPSLDFSTEISLKSDKEIKKQNLLFALGRNDDNKHLRAKTSPNMASIYMVYRETANLFTQFQTINDWFEYAHYTIDAVGLRDFPRFNADSDYMDIKKTKLNEHIKWEEIFHLPSLQIHFSSTIDESKSAFLCLHLPHQINSQFTIPKML